LAVLVIVSSYVAAAPTDENIELPSLLGMLGSKLAAADEMYDEYSADVDDSGNRVKEANACCFPDVWQGRLDSEFGFAPLRGGRNDNEAGKQRRGPVATRSVDMVYVDGSKKRMAGSKSEIMGRGNSLNVSYILLFGSNNTADLYLFNPTAKKCRYRAMKGVSWRRSCIPSNATLRGTYSLGPSTGGLRVQSWQFAVEGGPRSNERPPTSETNFVEDFWWSGPRTTTSKPRPRPGPSQFMEANVLVVPGQCIPVVIQESGSIRGRRLHDDDDDDDNSSSDEEGDEDVNSDNLFFAAPSKKTTRKPRPRPKPRPRGVAFVGGIYFSGLQTSIKDPSVFTVPSYCKKEDNLYYDEMEPEIPAVVERFLVL